MIAAIEAQREHYLPIFADFEKTAAGTKEHWLKRLRGDGFARFLEVGFPNTRVEDWRFTDISAIAQTEFQLAGAAESHISPQQVAKYQIEHHEIKGAACRLVFVNGQFAAELSSTNKLPEGVRVSSLAKQLTENPQELEGRLGRYLDIQRDPFSALNTAFLEDGAYVHVRKGVNAAAPIYLLFLSAGDRNGAPLMTHPRNLIVVEQGAEATVVEDYVSLDESRAFSNAATEAVAEDGAVLHHYLIERENMRSFNVSTLRLQLGRDSNVSSHSLLTGGAIVRNNVHPVMAGQGGECLINGLFIGGGKQHLDNYMLVEHAAAHCASRQFYNGILDQQAHGVFHGRIIVHKDAQKTDAKQTNRNLLLDDRAQIDTKPQLEIFADDVKCTHGATIGQLEENALFYLRSRGIDETAARQLLLRAFAGECLERMKESAARSYAEHYIHEYILRLADHHARATEAGDEAGRKAKR